MSVLNIVELQNVVASSSGLNPATYLSNQIMNIQEMVVYDEKRINVNVISNFNTTPIQFVSPVNFTGAITTPTGSLSSGANSSNLISSIGTSSFTLALGNISTPLQFTFAQTSNTVESTPLYMTANGDAVFSGSVSAQNFITSSDGRKKYSIRPITKYNTILSTITGVHFKWNTTNQDDVGVIAQDLMSVLPEAVLETPDGLQVAYMKLIPVLVEAIKDLQERVVQLETNRGFNTEEVYD
jgi:hypothetical protein